EASGSIVELTAIKSDGSSFPVDVSVSEVMVQDQPLYLVAMIDVSERHEIERLKQEFVAMVSHDLRTPLSSVQGMLAILSAGVAGELPAKAGTMVATAEGQLDRLVSLINDLLDVQKMEAGEFQIEKEQVAVSEVFRQSVGSVERLAEIEKITISLEETDATMFADGARIVQVLVNLLANAIKFSSA